MPKNKFETKPPLSKLLTVRQAAEILNVHVETLRRWDNSGKLPAIKINPRGDRRYRVEDLEAFIQQKGRK